MKIKFFQNIIDIIRGKKKINSGDNNKIINKIDGKLLNVDYDKKLCSIRGKNNRIVFVNSAYKNKFPKGLYIEIFGDDNYIEIHEPNFVNSCIYSYDSNNKFLLGKPIKEIDGAKFIVERGACIEIEKDCELGNSKLTVIVNGDYENKHKLYIGEGTHIAVDAIIRTSDGECLVDFYTNKPISEPEDIYIGKHCWITSRCIILKGTYLPDNTIVGANSLVNKKFVKENTLIAGSPAKVVKENVKWNKGPYCANMEQYIAKNAHS